MIEFSASIKNSRASAITSRIDASTTGGRIVIFSGEKPLGVGALTTQIELISFPLNKPSYASIDDGVITLRAIDEQMVATTGTAQFARIMDGDGGAVADISVGLIGSDADIKLPTLNVVQGAYIRLTSVKINGG